MKIDEVIQVCKNWRKRFREGDFKDKKRAGQSQQFEELQHLEVKIK